MAIDDPTAIPQTPDQLTEYMHEADRLWNDTRTAEAQVLYRSVMAGVSGSAESSLAAFRLALYLQSVGDINGALEFLEVCPYALFEAAVCGLAPSDPRTRLAPTPRLARRANRVAV